MIQAPTGRCCCPGDDEMTEAMTRDDRTPDRSVIAKPLIHWTNDAMTQMTQISGFAVKTRRRCPLGVRRHTQAEGVAVRR
jgi:hypothetical protein